MKLRKLFFSIILFGIVGCNSDDGSVPEEETLLRSSFTVIGQDAENVYQFSFDGETESSEQINLTEELNVTPNYLTLREIDDLLSFYYFRGGAFSLILKDVVSGASATYTDFFANTPGRSVAWGINNQTNVFFGFFGPFGTRNLGIQDVDFQGTMGTDTEIDIDIDFVFQPLLNDEKVYFVYRDNSGDYKFTFYNIGNQTNGPILNFGASTVSFMISDSGEVVIIENGQDATLSLYNPESLALLDTFSLDFGTGFNPGPIEGAVFSDNRLYYAFPYIQPAKYTAGPAIFDLETQENELIDFFDIAATVEDEIGQNITLTTQIFDSNQNVFFVGYGLLGNSVDGGVIQISAEGEFLGNVTTPFIPSYLVRN